MMDSCLLSSLATPSLRCPSSTPLTEPDLIGRLLGQRNELLDIHQSNLLNQILSDLKLSLVYPFSLRYSCILAFSSVLSVSGRCKRLESDSHSFCSTMFQPPTALIMLSSSAWLKFRTSPCRRLPSCNGPMAMRQRSTTVSLQ